MLDRYRRDRRRLVGMLLGVLAVRAKGDRLGRSRADIGSGNSIIGHKLCRLEVTPWVVRVVRGRRRGGIRAIPLVEAKM